MARQMFTGNYGAPLAQVDTRPILAAGQAWGQAFQNLGQVASDVLEKHRQKKERAKLEPIAEKFAQQALGGQAPADEVEAYKKGLLTPDGMKLLSGMQQMQAQQQQMQAQKQQMDFFQTVKDFKAQQEENQANRLGLLNKLSEQTFKSAETQAKWNEAIQAAFPANEVAALQKRQAEAQAVRLEQTNQLNARRIEIQNKIDKAVDPVEVAKLEQELLELNRDQALANITGTKARTEATIAGTDATKAQTKAVELETETKKKELELYPLAEQIKLKKDKDKAALGYTKAMTEGATATTEEKKRIAEVRKARNFVQVDSNGNVSVKQGGKNIAPDILEDAIFEKEKRWHEMQMAKLQREGTLETTLGKRKYAQYLDWQMTAKNAQKVPTTEAERHIAKLPPEQQPEAERKRLAVLLGESGDLKGQVEHLGDSLITPKLNTRIVAEMYRLGKEGGSDAVTFDEKKNTMKLEFLLDGKKEKSTIKLTPMVTKQIQQYLNLNNQLMGMPTNETVTPEPTPTQFNKEEAISNMRNYFNQ